jgi:hypothetical protein
VKRLSWIFWAAWAIVGVVFELYAVLTEKRSGAEPLTRVLRDRLMRRFLLARLAVLLFLSWLGLHFLVGGPSPLPW